MTLEGISWMVEQLLKDPEVVESISVEEARQRTLALLKEKGPAKMDALKRVMKRNEGSTYQILRLMVKDKVLDSVRVDQYRTYYRIPGDRRAFKD